MDDKKRLGIYDQYVNATLVNIYSLSKENKQIILGHFEPNDKEHLFLLSVATLASNMMNFPIYVDCNLLKYFKLKKLLGKRKVSVKRFKHSKENENWRISVRSMLNYERSQAKKILGEDFTFEDIFNEYYRKDYKIND